MTVSIVVLEEDGPEVREMFDKITSANRSTNPAINCPVSYLKEDSVSLWQIENDFVPYGIVSNIQDTMQNKFIPHTIEFSDPNDFAYRKNSLRFDDRGKLVQTRENYSSRFISFEGMKDWLRFSDSPEEFMKICQRHLKNVEEDLTPLPWIHQERNRNRARTRSLLTDG